MAVGSQPGKGGEINFGGCVFVFPAGRVVRSPGLQKRGFVAGDNLQPWKARLLLALALTKTTNADEIQRMFDTY